MINRAPLITPQPISYDQFLFNLFLILFSLFPVLVSFFLFSEIKTLHGLLEQQSAILQQLNDNITTTTNTSSDSGDGSSSLFKKYLNHPNTTLITLFTGLLFAGVITGYFLFPELITHYLHFKTNPIPGVINDHSQISNFTLFLGFKQSVKYLFAVYAFLSTVKHLAGTVSGDRNTDFNESFTNYDTEFPLN